MSVDSESRCFRQSGFQGSVRRGEAEGQDSAEYRIEVSGQGGIMLVD